ncbi:MAG: H-NS histone family protein [Marinobacterium sp.]|nr:H-NS histone family protein [Marinobacterium sp.]
MSEFISKLLRKNSLRKECGELSVAEIEKVISDLSDILADRQNAEAEKEAELAAKKKVIDDIQARLNEAGLTLEDLGGTATSEKRTVAPKYRLIDEHGKPHEWSGRGRTPRVFQERFDKGAQKEDFLIVQ